MSASNNNNNMQQDEQVNFDFDLDATDDFFNATDDPIDSEFTTVTSPYTQNTHDNFTATTNNTANNSSTTDMKNSNVNRNDHVDSEALHPHKIARVELNQNHSSHIPINVAASGNYYNISGIPENESTFHSNMQSGIRYSQSYQTNAHVDNSNNNNSNNNNTNEYVPQFHSPQSFQDDDLQDTFNVHDQDFQHDMFDTENMDFSSALPVPDYYNEQRNNIITNNNNNNNNINANINNMNNNNNNNNNNIGSNNANVNVNTTDAYETQIDAPPFIQNVQSYLPAVAPDAFPVIVAVLAQANINASIDLCELSCATRNVQFVPTRRAATATMRLHEPSAVILIRSSGAMNIIGSASISEARQAAQLAARIIRKALNLNFDTFQFRVRSLMARFNVCSPVRLEALARYRLDEQERIPGVGGVYGSYEPQRFSGCIVRILGISHRNRWSVSCTVFVTGKVTMLGARSEQELRFAFDALVPILAKFAVPLRDEVHQEGKTKVSFLD